MFSLTPATRLASIWTTSTAPAWSSCLNITRLWACSPVAIRTGTAALIGQRGVVLEAVGAESGLVKLKGEVWSARSFDPHHTIEAGRHVDVVQIDGATAVVYESEI